MCFQGHENWVLVVSWSPDARLLCTADMNGKIWLWDPNTGKPLGTCKGHRKWITSTVSICKCAILFRCSYCSLDSDDGNSLFTEAGANEFFSQSVVQDE